MDEMNDSSNDSSIDGQDFSHLNESSCLWQENLMDDLFTGETGLSVKKVELGYGRGWNVF